MFVLYFYILDIFLEPGVPGGLFVKVINTTNLNVSWFTPNVTNGHITAYEIVYSASSLPNETSLMVNTTTCINHRPHFHIIQEINPSTNYSLAVRAYTRIGAGNFSSNFSFQAGKSIATDFLSTDKCKTYKALKNVDYKVICAYGTYYHHSYLIVYNFEAL